jgi:predicted dienelactone hydrolase
MKQSSALILVLVMVVTSLVGSSPTIVGAQRPDAPKYARPGSFPIGTRDYTLDDPQRPLHITLWYPAAQDNSGPKVDYGKYGVGQAMVNAAPETGQGKFPLLVFAHGYGSERIANAYLTEHLASYGFVVAAADHADEDALSRAADRSGQLTPVEGAFALYVGYALRPYDVLREIDFAATLTGEGGHLQGLIDLERVGVTGFSFGGYTALAAGGARADFRALNAWCDANDRIAELKPGAVCFLRGAAPWIARERNIDPMPSELFPATTTPRVKVVLALAPWNGPIFGSEGLAALTLPTMIMAGARDDVTPAPRDGFYIYERLGSRDKTLVTFENAGHNIYSGLCGLETDAEARSCADPVWDRERAHDLINHFATAFILATLKDDHAAAQALTPDAVSASGFVGVDYQTTINQPAN